jgi:hypothetical protein
VILWEEANMSHRKRDWARTGAALGALVVLVGGRPSWSGAEDRGPAPLSRAILVVAPDAGLAAPVVVFSRPGGTEKFRVSPYGAGFKGGIRVAVGDVNGDGTLDVVTAPGRGTPVVRVFDGATGAPLTSALGSFNAYDPGFTGGVFVAAGDVNGDGLADVVTGAGAGKGGPHVKVFSGGTGTPLASFFAYDPAFRGGVRVAAGDVDGDGLADIVAGAGKGREGPRVKVFDGATLEVVADFYPFDPAARGGVFVAAGDLNGDDLAEVVTGPERDGDPHVRAFTGSGVPFASFFAYDRAFRGGIRVAVGDVDGLGRGELVSAPGKGRLGPIVRFFNAVKNGTPVGANVVPFDPAFLGGVFVAAGN